MMYVYDITFVEFMDRNKSLHKLREDASSCLHFLSPTRLRYRFHLVKYAYEYDAAVQTL